PAAPDVDIELRRGREPRELVRIGVGGVVIGPEGGPLVWKMFPQPRRADDAWYFFRVFAPFTLQTREGDVVFRGRGAARADPTEQRMILEWARQVAVEAASGRGAAAYGLMLAWHQGGPTGICEDVVLYLTGEVVATACGWEREVRGRLDPEALSRVYGWFDRLMPFQTGDGEESPRPGQLQMRLVFAGRGTRAPTASSQAEIQSLAAAVFGELAARRRGSVSVPTAAGTPIAAPAPRFLLPPDAGVRPQGILLELPEKPPPAPSPPPPLLPPPLLSRPLPSPLTHVVLFPIFFAAEECSEICK